jgi:hypothetical protein
LVDADSYMLELVRYIHNNPLRAGMAKNAADYKWSSHQAYLGLQEQSILTTDWLLGQFAVSVTTARRMFDEFVNRGDDEGHREEFYRGQYDSRVLGDECFAEKVLARKIHAGAKPSLDKIVQYFCKENGISEEELRSASRQRKLSDIRGMIAWVASRIQVATLTEVAKRFHRDLTTISRAVRKVEERSLSSTEFKKQLNDTLERLTR